MHCVREYSHVHHSCARACPLPGLAISILVFFLSPCSFSAAAQTSPVNWKEVDRYLSSYSQPVRNAVELRAFGAHIRSNWPDSFARLQIAYAWVTRHIVYDCEGVKRKQTRWALDSVLKNRKAVCAGYVNVFRNLCEAAGLPCIDIQGYGRSGMEDLVIKRDSTGINHTWNAVRLGSEWKLVDVTWASGYTLDDCSNFISKRNDWYFCSDPSKFIWDHYPADSSWQLLRQTVSWQDFQQFPLVYPGVVENNLDDFYPKTVLLQKQKGDTIQFYFKTRKTYNRMIISSRKEAGIYRMDWLTKVEGGYAFLYIVPLTGQYDLQIDLLWMDTPAPLQSYTVKTYTDLVYWIYSGK